MDKRIGAMVVDLGVPANIATLDMLDDNPELAAMLVELWDRQVKLAAAMDRVFPGWQMGNAACLPNCQGACCEPV